MVMTCLKIGYLLTLAMLLWHLIFDLHTYQVWFASKAATASFSVESKGPVVTLMDRDGCQVLNSFNLVSKPSCTPVNYYLFGPGITPLMLVVIFSFLPFLYRVYEWYLSHIDDIQVQYNQSFKVTVVGVGVYAGMYFLVLISPFEILFDSLSLGFLLSDERVLYAGFVVALLLLIHFILYNWGQHKNNLTKGILLLLVVVSPFVMLFIALMLIKTMLTLLGI